MQAVEYNNPEVVVVKSRCGAKVMKECRKFRVEGRVQGVWFRQSTRQEAERLGVTGYAVNCPDGSVEVLACGDPAVLDRLAQWLHHGPPMAQVFSVTATSSNAECPERFSTG